MKMNEHGAPFAQQPILQKGMKAFGKKGHNTLHKELDQLHKRSCFAPLTVKELDQLHKRSCFAPLTVKDMKPSKRKKAPMRELLSQEDVVASLTADNSTREHHDYSNMQSFAIDTSKNCAGQAFAVPTRVGEAC
jgi:hypothetical protein